MTGDGTRCVHGGHRWPGLGEPVHPGPVLSSTFALGLPDDPLPPDFYGRAGNPTWRALEAAIGELDGGECVLFASGMAAIGAVLRLRAADGALVLPSDGYYLARSLAHAELAPLGVEVREVPTTGPGSVTGHPQGPRPDPGPRANPDPCADPDPCARTPRLARTQAPTRAHAGPDSRARRPRLARTQTPTRGPGVLDGAALVLVETPSNPGLDVVDIAAAAAAAHAAGALLAVDNTTATPLGQRPLDLGADLTVASDTKALAGHGDVVLGHVSVRDPALAAALREARSRGGAVPGPMEVWLAHRGLGTLDLRLARQAENARAVASALLEHPAVTDVRWPGLASDPAHAVAARQMRRWNGVLRFTLASEAAVGEFLAASRLVGSATSFGGLRSTADRRARWGDDVAPGLLRFSAGCEDPADLVADVVAALGACSV